jgi:hypothetical protein
MRVCFHLLGATDLSKRLAHTPLRGYTSIILAIDRYFMPAQFISLLLTIMIIDFRYKVHMMVLISSHGFDCIHPEVPRPSFSNGRDLAITAAIGKHSHLGVNLLSLTSSGCRARIVLLTEIGHLFDARFLRIARLTGTEIFRFPWNKTVHRHTDLARVIWFYEWLAPRREQFDRIFWFDAFDVFFQSDPFRTLISPNKMTFISEDVLIKYERTNYKWIRSCFGTAGAEAVKHGRVICFGTVGGTTDVFLRFLAFMVGNRTQWFQCLLDQPQLNYYVHTGALAQQGIEYQFQGCNSTVLSLSFCPRMKVHFTYQNNRFFELSSDANVVTSAVVHHYKAIKGSLKNYYRRCHHGVV